MEREKTFLTTKRPGLQWDWWQESPVEIILVAFILVMFLVPRTGCGITPKTDLPNAAAQQAAQPPAAAPAEQQ